MKWISGWSGACAALALCGTAAAAQVDGSQATPQGTPQAGSPAEADAAIPSIESVEVPAITEGRDSKVVRNGWKYFYFYRADTTYEQAYADIAECYSFLPVPGRTAPLPGFTPWDARPDGAVVVPQPSIYGPVGELIGSLVAGPIERRMSQSRMRRCMEPRGYERFPMSKENWEAVIDNYSQGSIAMQAKLVAQGQPDADPLPVTR